MDGKSDSGPACLFGPVECVGVSPRAIEIGNDIYVIQQSDEGAVLDKITSGFSRRNAARFFVPFLTISLLGSFFIKYAWDEWTVLAVIWSSMAIMGMLSFPWKTPLKAGVSSGIMFATIRGVVYFWNEIANQSFFD